MNNNNSNNNNKYNFNYEEVGEIKDLLEAVIIDLDFIKSYARIIEDKLKDIRTGHHLDQRKDLTTDLTTMLALEYHEAQRDLEHYINLSYSIDDKIKDSNDLVKKVFDLLNSKRDAEETTKEISTAS